jgi:hypothetical protein
MITLKWSRVTGKWQTTYKGFVITESVSSVKAYRKNKPMFTLTHPNVKYTIDSGRCVYSLVYKADNFKGKK